MRTRSIAAALVALSMMNAASVCAQAPAVPEGAAASAAEDDGDPRVELSLLSDHEAVRAGQTIRVGVLFRLDPHWHVYFRNPGQAALGTEVIFEAEGARLGPIEWPVPTRLTDPSGLITTFGYEDEVVLGASATIADDAARSVELEATADFLVCRVDCIPGRVSLRRTIAIEETPRPSEAAERDRITRTRSALPQTPEDAGVRVALTLAQRALRPGDRARAAIAVITCEGPPAAGGRCLAPRAPPQGMASAFFPDRVPGLEVEVTAVRPHPSAYAGAVIDLALRAGPDDPGEGQALSGVVSLATDEGPLALEVEGAIPRAPASAAREPIASPLFAGEDALEEVAVSEAAAPPSLLVMLLFALLGGVILNAMPCVLPVLALKAFGLAQMAGERRGARVAHTAAYTAGIALSMLALAAVVIALRAAGTEVGWGFQLQEPIFATVLSAVLVVFALGMFGVFEIGVDATRLASRVDAQRGLSRSVGEGVLAVVLATPCSAPFLGTAIGFAFASDALTIVLTFLAVGLGLAAPFALIALVPGARRVLPKPGPWMVALSRGLGFALLGTAVWLLWIVGQVAGVDAMARALALLVGIGGATWAIVRSRHGRAWTRRLVPVAALIAVGLGGAWALGGERARDADRSREAWSPEAVARHLAEGRPVFVDFTAAWCITCQANERLVLGSEAVAEAFAEADVAFLVADWTERDERIRAELARHGKAGVPLYLLFSPSAPNEPEVLPELLTEGLVLDALARVEGGSR